MRTNKRAVGIILKDNKILLMRRVRNGRHYIVFPGGGVEEGESVEEALVREMNEEFCIDVKIDSFLYEMKIGENPADPGRSSHYYIIKEFTGDPVLGGEEKDRMSENDQFYPHWIDLKDIEKTENLYPEVARKFLVDYLKKQSVI